MNRRHPRYAWRLAAGVAASIGVLGPATAGAQSSAPQVPPLFASTGRLAVTLTADFTALRGDRRASPDRPLTIGVTDDSGALREIAAEIRTRGQFRLDPTNCSFPPLRIDVDGASAVGTVFEGQDDLKFVSSCRPGRSSWEELVVAEYLAYRSVNTVTDASFRVRRLDVTFVDTGGDDTETRAGFVIEDADALAARLGARVYELEDGRMLPPAAFDPIMRMTTAVAQHMLGNHDWSDIAGHNVEIFDREAVALSVPYDFDMTGIVDAPYAAPPEEYRFLSVRTRYYRGWCENPMVTGQVLERFRSAREAMIALWRNEPGLSDRRRSRAISYLEDFFDSIETDERAGRRFLRDCRPMPG